MLNRISVASLVVLALGAVTPAHAATITITGSEFDVVYDDTTLGLFNTPVLVGNVLFFTPSTFSDQSMNGNGLKTTSSTATGLQLVAHPGFEFATLAVDAQGDYLMTGAGSSVNVTGSLTATDATQPLTQTTVALSLNPSLPLTLNDGASHNWAGASTITGATPTDTPGHNPWLPTARTVDFTLANTLYADTTTGTGPQQAFIQEKFAGLQLYVDPIAVPLPGTAALLLSVVALVSGMFGFSTLSRARCQG